MTESVPIPAKFVGARWVRAALQVNPFGYKGKNSPSSNFDNEAAYNKALLDRCESEQVEIIAVTDHWCVDTATGLIADAASRPVTVLPGFEANTSEGIHLLVIFEAGTEAASINAAIGACGVSPGCDNGTTGDAYADVIREMTARGALVIPAHANVANSGMLTGRAGKPLEKMIKNSELHAIAITPSVTDAKDQIAILTGTKPFDRQYQIAQVHADDVCHPDGLVQVGGSTWFKVSSLSLAAIKHAVRIPVTRVSLKDPENVIRVTFRELSWTGGFLDGASISLSDDLTALIGGRGTGKSSVIESLRYVLAIEPIGDESARDHSSIVDHVLQSGTLIRLVVSAVSPTRAEYVIQRTVPDPPIVLDASGTRTTLKPIDVVGKIEIFGQHELAEVAQHKTSVARMIEGFASGTDNGAEHDEIMRSLERNREELARLEGDKSRLEDELAQTERLEEAMAQYQASDLAGKLKEQKRLGQDEATFKEGRDRLEVTQKSIDQLVNADVVAQLRQTYEAIDESEFPAELSRVSAATTLLSDEIAKMVVTVTDALKVAKVEIEAANVAWKTATEPQREKHAEVLRKLKAEGHEPDKYLATSKALDLLKAKVPRLNALKKQIKTLLTARNTLLGELHKNEDSRRARLNEAIREANEATTGSVIVKPVASPDRQDLQNCVTKYVQNSRVRLLEAISASDFSPRAFAEAARSGPAVLEQKYEIKGAQASAITAAGEPFLREFEELTIAQAVDVSLDVSSDPNTREFRKLDELSKGQRATALLLLLLGAGESPLIIDQPEDDLDNRFVYDQVVQLLRALKGNRQVVVSTHNANIPVLGDAELIVTLEGNGHRGWPLEGGSGSLDNPDVRDNAEHILEGGRAAFDARRHLYGF